MIETWHQWTCDGCGETECTSTPCLSKAEVRAALKKSGWKHYTGDLDYCHKCVANGNAKNRIKDMNHQ